MINRIDPDQLALLILSEKALTRLGIRQFPQSPLRSHTLTGKVPMPTRSRGPYVSSLSEKSVPNQALLIQDKIHKARSQGYKNGVHSQTQNNAQ